MYKQYLDEELKFPCASCEYGNVMCELTVHTSTRRRQQLHFYNACDSKTSEPQLISKKQKFPEIIIF